MSGTAGVFQYLNVEVRGFGPGNLHLWPGGQSTWSVGRPEKPRPEESRGFGGAQKPRGWNTLICDIPLMEEVLHEVGR